MTFVLLHGRVASARAPACALLAALAAPACASPTVVERDGAPAANDVLRVDAAAHPPPDSSPSDTPLPSADARASDGATTPADATGLPGVLECATSGDVAAMPARTWCRVAGSAMRAVVPTGAMLEAVRANSGPQAIVTAWNSAALDTRRNRLVVWGGGHMDYAGNEVYVFDLATLRWSRLNDPTTSVGGDEASGVYPDGLPRARHTYNYLGYLPPPVDRFCAFGGAAFYPSGQTGDHHTVCFDFEALRWERRADALYGGNPIGAFSAFDPVTGHYFAHGGASPANLAEYDPAADRWTRHVVDDSGWTSYYYTAAIDPRARRFVAIGNDQALSWDLTHPERPAVALARTGDGVAATHAACAGVEYDPVAQRIVIWQGGGDVYTLDVATATWARVAPAAGNRVAPGDAHENGTRGRFRYVPALNAFVLVTSIDDDVFLYRLAPTP